MQSSVVPNAYATHLTATPLRQTRRPRLSHPSFLSFPTPYDTMTHTQIHKSHKTTSPAHSPAAPYINYSLHSSPFLSTLSLSSSSWPLGSPLH